MILVTVSTGFFDPLFEACAKLSSKYSFLGQIGMSRVEPPFPFVRTVSPEKLDQLMRESELVISHAGTGNLSRLYVHKKKVVVVPKQKKYGEANDSQVELAKKWEQIGLGVLCLDLNELEAAIEKAKSLTFRHPQIPSLGETLCQSLSLPSGHLTQKALPF